MLWKSTALPVQKEINIGVLKNMQQLQTIYQFVVFFCKLPRLQSCILGKGGHYLAPILLDLPSKRNKKRLSQIHKESISGVAPGPFIPLIHRYTVMHACLYTKQTPTISSRSLALQMQFAPMSPITIKIGLCSLCFVAMMLQQQIKEHLKKTVVLLSSVQMSKYCSRWMTA